MLENVHMAGYVYNDLKLDNLLLDFDTDVESLLKTDDDIFDENNVTLIDFGFVSSYLQKHSREHIAMQSMKTYQGNMVLSSLSMLQFESSSRRDDLKSLFYLMVYVLKKGNMPGIKIEEGQDLNDLFLNCLEARENETEDELCCGNTEDFKTFYREVSSYKFK